MKDKFKEIILEQIAKWLKTNKEFQRENRENGEGWILRKLEDCFYNCH